MLAALLTILAAQSSGIHYTKRAFLVGAWDYRSSRWANLSSKEDVSLIAAKLREKFQWDETHGGKIVILTDRADTTRQKILDTFKQFLTTDVREGDTIYFHYSGHGYYAPDVDPAKHPDVKLLAPVNPVIGNAVDGLDETLVPTDDPDHDANQIRGDELGLLVDQIKQAAAGKHVSILVTLDCCHSFGGTRSIGTQIFRGRPYTGPRYHDPVVLDPNDPTFLKIKKVEGYTVVSACGADQEAGQAKGPDGKEYGKLTLALVDALGKCGPGTTYRDLFDSIDTFIASKYNFGSTGPYSQNPHIEGVQDATVFGGSASPRPPYFSLLRVGASDYQLKAGEIDGLMKGATLRLFHPKDNLDTSQAFATVTVQTPGLITSDVTFDPPQSSLSQTDLDTARAVVVSQGVEDVNPSIDLSSITHRPDAGQIVEKVRADNKLAKIATTPAPSADLQVEFFDPATVRGPVDKTNPKTAGYRIFRISDKAEITVGDNGESAPIPAGPDAAGLISQRIFDETRYEALGRLRNQTDSQRKYVEIKIVPCDVDPAGQHKYKFKAAKTAQLANDGLHTHNGDFYALQYRVHGNWSPYVAVLDLTRDGHPDQLWPNPEVYGDPVTIDIPASGQPSADWQYLKDPRSDQVSVFQVTPPFGNEILKVVATELPISFAQVMDHDGHRGVARGATTPLGGLFTAFAKNQTRSAAMSGAGDEEIWSTREVKMVVSN